MSRSPLPNVHPTAVISDEAILPLDVKIGAFAVIEGRVVVGPGCVIHPHAHLIGPLTLGANNQVGNGTVLGGAPQHLGYKGESTAVEIGEGNIFREYVTVHRAMPHGVGMSGVTRIGNRNLFMVGSHVGHDSVIGNDCILTNGSMVGGHAILEDRVLMSGNAAVHQFCRVGRLAFVSGLSATSKDLPPFWMVRQVNVIRGINLVGMRRAGIPSTEILAVRKAFRIIYMSRPALLLSEAVARIDQEMGHLPAVRELVSFIRNSKRGVCGAHHFAGNEEDDESSAAA